jgi:diaminohydroxyphosphoribosylaminopyrimidine deaminase/5-amino-6-(5-phosphoribosylamino)uracil reductase
VEQPLRVIVEGHHVVPPDAAIFNEAGRVLLVGPRSLPSRKEVPPGAEYWSVDSDHEKLDLGQLIKRLADQGCNEVLVEAGPTLAGAFVSAGLVDEIWIYQSPDIIGASGRGMFVMPGIKTIQEKISFELIDSRPVGGDVRSIYLPREKGL